MQTSKTLARLYCPNPKDPTEGLRQKANGVWERNEVIDGKRKSFSSRDPIEAWRKRSEYIITREERRQEEQLLEELGPLFEDVAERYRAQVLEMKHGTQKSYLPGITRALGQFRGRRIKSIEPWEIKAFLTGLNGAHTTVSNQKTVLNAIFQLYIDDPQWHGNYNPAKMTTLPRGLPRSRRQPPKEDQVQIVKASLGDPEALPAIIYLCTGERRGEACAIQLKDIDFKNDIINITKAVEWISNQPHITRPKTDAGIRQHPLLNLLKEALLPYRNLPPRTYIVGMGSKPVTASEYSRRWARFWRKHGYAHPIERTYKRIRNGKEYQYHQTDWSADVCAHQFRHEYVCMLCETGVPEEIAIQLVGHANAKMIHEVYLHLKPSMIKAAGKLLNEKITAEPGLKKKA